MRSRRRFGSVRVVRLAEALCAVVALGAGCGAASAPIRLGPSATRVIDNSRYEEIRQRYSRHAHLTYDWDTALDAEVVLLAPEFRAAWVGRVTALRNLPAADRDHLAEEQERDAAEHVELLVAMQTSRWEWNDLSATNSVWTITFHDDAGRSVSSVARVGLNMKMEALEVMVPGVNAFTRSWKVRFPVLFPDGTPLLPPNVKRVAVKFAGPLGEAWLRWDVR